MINVFTQLKNKTMDTKREVEAVNERMFLFNNNVSDVKIYINKDNVEIHDKEKVSVMEYTTIKHLESILNSFFSKRFFSNSNIDKYILYKEENGLHSEFTSLDRISNPKTIGIIVCSNPLILSDITDRLIYSYGYLYSSNFDNTFIKILK